MVSKTKEHTEETEAKEEASETALGDKAQAAVKRMIARAKARGYVTYDELNKVLPTDQVSSEQIEDVMATLSEMGISVIEAEEEDAPASAEASDEAEEGDEEDGEEEEEAEDAASGNIKSDDVGRTDDPVRMYLREMGTVELLSREGEIAIAKRIEAGREKMIGGLCESPLTIRALLLWRDALQNGELPLRDIIDLDATYGAGPDAAGDNSSEEDADGSSKAKAANGDASEEKEEDDADEEESSLS